MKQLKLAWHLLRGRPVAYKIHFIDGTVRMLPWTHYHTCSFDNVRFVDIEDYEWKIP